MSNRPAGMAPGHGTGAETQQDPHYPYVARTGWADRVRLPRVPHPSVPRGEISHGQGHERKTAGVQNPHQAQQREGDPASTATGRDSTTPARGIPSNPHPSAEPPDQGLV